MENWMWIELGVGIPLGGLVGWFTGRTLGKNQVRFWSALPIIVFVSLGTGFLINLFGIWLREVYQ